MKERWKKTFNFSFFLVFCSLLLFSFLWRKSRKNISETSDHFLFLFLAFFLLSIYENKGKIDERKKFDFSKKKLTKWSTRKASILSGASLGRWRYFETVSASKKCQVFILFCFLFFLNFLWCTQGFFLFIYFFPLFNQNKKEKKKNKMVFLSSYLSVERLLHVQIEKAAQWNQPMFYYVLQALSKFVEILWEIRLIWFVSSPLKEESQTNKSSVVSYL